MPSINLAITAAGPVLNVYLLPSGPRQEALRAAGQPIPSPTVGQFLVDTGASNTAVDSSLITPLGLSATGAIMCHTPSTGQQAVPFSQYDVMLVIPGADQSQPAWIVDALPVMESQFLAQGIHGLIGRDMLEKGILIYNGTGGVFSLAY